VVLATIEPVSALQRLDEPVLSDASTRACPAVPARAGAHHAPETFTFARHTDAEQT